jgi:YbgC/YbaW family acyl-CoA thioester hydrolase
VQGAVNKHPSLCRPRGSSAYRVQVTEQAASHQADETSWFRVTMPVRWADCDPAGIVYYPNYYTFQEVATVEFLRRQGMLWRQLEQRYGGHFPRVESHCRYLASCSYEDVVDVGLHVSEISRKIITMQFRVWRQPDGARLCDGFVKFALVPFPLSADDRPRAQELPDGLRVLFGALG